MKKRVPLLTAGLVLVPAFVFGEDAPVSAPSAATRPIKQS